MFSNLTALGKKLLQSLIVEVEDLGGRGCPLCWWPYKCRSCGKKC